MKNLKKESTILPVVECYAYRYDYGKGKTVLRVKVDAADATFAEVQEFFNEVSDFEQWDENIENLETIYTDYGADLDIHYKKPVDSVQPDGSIKTENAFYDVEVLRDPSVEADMRNLYKENESLKVQIQELLSTIEEIESGNQEKEQTILELQENITNLSGLPEEISNLKISEIQIDAMSQRIAELEAENAENVEIQAEILYELCLTKIEKEAEEDGLQDIEEID